MMTAIRPILVIVLFAGALAFLEGKAAADQADDQFAVAAGHYDRQDWKLAVDEFRTFIEKYPKDHRANEGVFYLGEALHQLGKYGEARQQFQLYSSREPKGKHAPAAMFGAGEAAYLGGDLVVAKADLVQFAKKYSTDPLNAYASAYLGDIALSSGDAAAAAAYFQKGLNQFSEGRSRDDCRLGLARAMEKQNRADEAEQLYSALANKRDSHLADAAQFRLGVLQFTLGRYDKAMESFSPFEGRLAKSPWQANARLGNGLALLKLHRPTEAIKQFGVVLATPLLDEELAQQASRGVIEAALQSKDYAMLDREAAQFEKRYSKSVFVNDVRRMLARSLVERREYAKVVALLAPLVGEATAARIEPTGLENRYLLAAGYEGLKRYDEALAAILPVVDDAKGQLKLDAQLKQGTVLLAMKKYADAIAPLDAFLAERPTGDVEAKAIGELAICCARAGQLDKAKKLYADLVRKHPGHSLIAPTTEHLADAAYDANDTAWATVLSSRLAALGDSVEYELKGKLSLGWSQFKAGKLDEADATFDDLLKRNPPEAIAAEAMSVRARILQELGRNDASLAVYGQLIERYPNSQQHADAMLAAAQLRQRMKQGAQAAALYEQLVKEHPKYPKLDVALYEWAWTMQELGKPSDASRLFKQLRKECPQSRFAVDAACRLAERSLEAKDYQQANSLADEVLSRKSEGPGDAKVRQYAMFLRGQIAVGKSDWPKAREAFEAMVKAYPESERRAAAEYLIAEAYYREGNYDAAATRFQKLAEQLKGKREPWMAMISLRQAQIAAQRNQLAEAYEIAAKIEKEFPSFEQQYEVDYLMGRCLANQADFDAARKMYDKAIQSATGAKTETAAMAQWMIGESYFHQKNFEAALREYSRLEILYAYPTWQAGALLQAGKCCRRLGQAKEAVKRFQKVVKMYPDTTFAKDAAKELAQLERTTSQH
jgi:cellulose synthase operon protein C